MISLCKVIKEESYKIAIYVFTVVAKNCNLAIRGVARPWQERQLPRVQDFRERKIKKNFAFITKITKTKSLYKK